MSKVIEKRVFSPDRPGARVIFETWDGPISDNSFDNHYIDGLLLGHFCDKGIVEEELRMRYIFMEEKADNLRCPDCGETATIRDYDSDFDDSDIEQHLHTGEQVQVRLEPRTRDSLLEYLQTLKGLIDPRAHGIILPGYRSGSSLRGDGPPGEPRPIATPRKRSQDG